MLDAFKKKLVESFDVKLFGRMSTLLGWETSFSSEGIKISQTRYTQELLDRHGMAHCNGTFVECNGKCTCFFAFTKGSV